MDTTDPAIQERIQQCFKILNKDLNIPRARYSEDTILMLATAKVDADVALSLLDFEQRFCLEAIHIGMEVALKSRVLMNNVFGRDVLDKTFTLAQREQAIGYMEATVFRGPLRNNSDAEKLRLNHACHWSARLRGFKIVWIPRP